jgi:hypothetical protein
VGTSVYRYRFAAAAVILALCVLFELSGSSIDCLSQFFNGELTGSGVLFGSPQVMRSDEFAVMTPFSLSQYFNHSGAYPYFSETIRGTLTDTFIVYGQPSWDIATVFRPFFWGYLLLGPAKGLSFFWVARLLALFLISFEFAMVYTRKDKLLSLAAAFLIALAPIVQWWFAVNGLVEMLVFGQLALLSVRGFLRSSKAWVRLLASLLFFWCLGAYILTFYPAWQVPLVYVFAALLVYVVLENRKAYVFRPRIDILAWALGLCVLVVGLLYVYSKSADTVATVLGTAYPGARVDTGGGELLSLFSSAHGGLPAPESAAFLDLFPLGILLALYLIFVEKKRDPLLIPLLAAQLLLLVYCVFGLPEPLARASLLSLSFAHRTLLAVGFANILLLLRSLALMERSPRVWQAAAVALVLAAGVGFLCRMANIEHFGRLYTLLLMAALFVCFLGVLLLHRNAVIKRLVVAALIVAVCIEGGLVNPIQRGLDVIYESELVSSIEEISRNDDGLWLVEASFPVTNLPIVVGAPTMNSTNVYPDLERWRQLDPSGEYEDIYNRYAHINVELSDDATSFELVAGDAFKLHLNYRDLSTLEVSYLMSTQDYRAKHNPAVDFTLLDRVGSYYLYELDYAENTH